MSLVIIHIIKNGKYNVQTALEILKVLRDPKYFDELSILRGWLIEYYNIHPLQKTDRLITQIEDVQKQLVLLTDNELTNDYNHLTERFQ